MRTNAQVHRLIRWRIVFLAYIIGSLLSMESQIGSDKGPALKEITLVVNDY